jgi:hypothetical protein
MMKLLSGGVVLILVCVISFAALGERKTAKGEERLHGDAIAPIPPADQSSIQDMLVSLEKQSWVAWKDRDGKFFERFLSDDHVEVGFSGPNDKATVVTGVASPACMVKSYSIENFKVVLLAPDAAVVTYHAAQDTTCNGKPVPSPAWASSIYIKRGDRWLNAVYQQSADIRK